MKMFSLLNEIKLLIYSHILLPYRKMKKNTLFLVKSLAVILTLGTCWNNLQANETFAPREVGFRGMIDNEVAMFLPNDLSVNHLPHSFALVQQPSPKAELTSEWKVVPSFSFSETKTRATVTISEGTSLYGSGEVTGPLLRNGTHVTLWNSDNYTYKDDNGQRLYESHPWILAVRPDGTSFGVIADTTWRTEIDLDGNIQFTSEGPSFPVIIIEENSPQEVLGKLADLTGHMPLPPRWALGYQQSRWSYHPDTQVKAIADEFRKREIPCDVIWMDIDYMDGFRVFTFDPVEFPDPKDLNDYLHQKDFHSVWMIDPGVKADPNYSVYQSGSDEDVWVHDAFGTPYHGSVWPGDCVFPDFTRPETQKWWSALYSDFMKTGIDGVWNDMNEPAVFNVPAKTMPPHNWFRGGDEIAPGNHARYHNVYGMLMVEATRKGIQAVNPYKRPFVLTRANFLGGQRYAAVWTGDNAATWEHMKWSVPMTLNLGLSGQAFNGPDMGGFSKDATADLWGNWVSFGAFFPFARGHADKGFNQKEPWVFGPEIESVARTALERRYRLLPYLYSVFRESSVTGLPIMRPIFFADITDLRLRAEDQAFLIGDDVMIIPKWAENPQVPEGWPAVSLVGENALNDKWQAEIRLRPGSIVPLGKVIQSTNEDSLDPLTLLIALDEDGNASGKLYEDNGDGYDYQKGQFLLTEYKAIRESNEVSVRVLSQTGEWERPARSVQIVVVGNGIVLGEAVGTDGDTITVHLQKTGK
jgi:alpha-glucosidase